MFRLLRYFSITSAVAILSVIVVLVVLYRHNAVSDLVEMAEAQNVVLARSFANTIWPRYSSYVTSVSGLDGDALRARPETRQIHDALKTLSAGLPVLKVKIYNLDGLTVFSSEASQIGVDKSNNPGFLAAARDGKPASKLVHKGKFSAFSGEVVNRELVESYLPIRRSDGPVEGVFELYSDVTPLIDRIQRSMGELVVGLFLVFGLLYAVLFLVVRHADLILKRQYIDVLQGEKGIAAKNAALEREIADRKQAEEALRESEERYRAIFDAAFDCIITMDRDGNAVEFNSPAESCFGYKAEDVAGKPMVDLIIPERMREAHRRELERFLESGEGPVLGKRIEIEAMRADGSEFLVELAIEVVSRSEGPFFVAHLRDITESKQAEEALRESEERFRAVVDHSPGAIVIKDMEGRNLIANKLFCTWYGTTSEKIIGKSVYDFLAKETADRITAQEQMVMETGTVIEEERQVTYPDGVTRSVFTQKFPIFGPDGDCLAVGTVINDITERKQAEEALRESEERFRTLIDGSSQGILVHRNLRTLYVNQSLIEMFGYDSADEILALESREVMTAPEERARLLGYHKARLRGETAPVDYEYKGLRKDGAKIWLENRSFRIEWEGGPAICTTLFDITKRKRAEAHIKHLALHDSLTDLPNRSLFHDRLQSAVAQSERTGKMLALLFIDLDDFKDVNDTLGHAAGDELLKAVAERLKSYLRKSDTVGRYNTTLARLGGDEFTILLTNLSDPVGAATVADRIIEDLSRPFSVGANVIHTGACIGIAVYPSRGGSPEELLKMADLALYRSKAEGRNRYHFYNEQMESEIRARKDLERDLGAALAEGQLSLVYQPQMDIKSGAMVGVEALLRWNHPDRGLIPPVEFIPIAEAIGLIVPIGEWVLRQACAQNKAWQEAGLPAFAVAVNLSAVQFRQADLVATVHDALQQAGLDAAYLHIEITETVFMQDGAREVLLDFRRSGIDISLDDFGTGYSSLSYLTRFPVDKIKLDRSFVRDIAHDTSNAAIIKAVVDLGHSLGMRVNVEGVETGDVLSILTSYGVDEIQGYYYSHPLPADGVAEFLTEIAAPSNRVATPA